MSANAIVLGSGVNELVAAQRLARAGLRVTMIAGPEAAAAPESGWVPEALIREFDLARHGLVVSRPQPWAIVPLEGGRRLELGEDIARTAEAIGELSTRDAGRWPAFCARMHRFAGLLEAIYLDAPPDPLAQGWSALTKLARLGLKTRGLGRPGMEAFLRLLPMSVADLLDDEFESDALKGALGAAGVMHLARGPRAGGTAFNLLHHHVGSPAGVFRPPVSNLREVLLRLPGVVMSRGRPKEIAVHEGRVCAVVLADGTMLDAPLVVSGLDPARTLTGLMDPGWLDPELVRALSHVRCRGVAARLALTLDRDPGFSNLVVAPGLDYLERAADDAKYGRASREPHVEARHSAAPDGSGHRVDVHVQYVPYSRGEAQIDAQARSRYVSSVIALLAAAAPGFEASVVRAELMLPHDLEASRGCPEGQEYHAEMALDQILWMRPLPQLAHYATPIGGLYLCGPAMHPGGAIAGAAGAHAARRVLADLRRGPAP